jgi:hypothetical protein
MFITEITNANKLLPDYRFLLLQCLSGFGSSLLYVFRIRNLNFYSLLQGVQEVKGVQICHGFVKSFCAQNRRGVGLQT